MCIVYSGVLNCSYPYKYNLSSRVSHGELQKWSLLTGGLCLERQKLPFKFSRDELRLVFIDRKPLLAGVLMYRFDCITFRSPLLLEIWSRLFKSIRT